MALKQAISAITIEEYLSGEEISEIRHELIDGEVYASRVFARIMRE